MPAISYKRLLEYQPLIPYLSLHTHCIRGLRRTSEELGQPWGPFLTCMKIRLERATLVVAKHSLVGGDTPLATNYGKKTTLLSREVKVN